MQRERYVTATQVTRHFQPSRIRTAHPYLIAFSKADRFLPSVPAAQLCFIKSLIEGPPGDRFGS